MTTDPTAIDGPGYAAAIAELEGILRELEGDTVDVDVLSTKVRRASDLLRVCRDRIDNTRIEVERIVADLDAPPQAPISAPPPISEPAGDGEPPF